MNHLLITIPICGDNAVQAERLLDFIHTGSPRKSGHVVLAFARDVSPEMRERIRMSAEMGFNTQYEFELKPVADPLLPKVARINNAFQQTALFIERHFRWPFLWLEPDNVPLHASVFSDLAEAYENQPRLFFGNRMKAVIGTQEIFFMARNSIYPADAIKLMGTSNVQAAFEIAAGAVVEPKMTRSMLFQQLIINAPEDLANIRPDAVLIHGDKRGILLEKLIAERVPAWDGNKPVLSDPPYEVAIEPSPEPTTEAVAIKIPKRRGRPPKIQPVATNGVL